MHIWVNLFPANQSHNLSNYCHPHGQDMYRGMKNQRGEVNNYIGQVCISVLDVFIRERTQCHYLLKLWMFWYQPSLWEFAPYRTCDLLINALNDAIKLVLQLVPHGKNKTTLCCSLFHIVLFLRTFFCKTCQQINFGVTKLKNAILQPILSWNFSIASVFKKCRKYNYYTTPTNNPLCMASFISTHLPRCFVWLRRFKGKEEAKSKRP